MMRKLWRELTEFLGFPKALTVFPAGSPHPAGGKLETGRRRNGTQKVGFAAGQAVNRILVDAAAGAFSYETAWLKKQQNNKTIIMARLWDGRGGELCGRIVWWGRNFLKMETLTGERILLNKAYIISLQKQAPLQSDGTISRPGIEKPL